MHKLGQILPGHENDLKYLRASSVTMCGLCSKQRRDGPCVCALVNPYGVTLMYLRNRGRLHDGSPWMEMLTFLRREVENAAAALTKDAARSRGRENLRKTAGAHARAKDARTQLAAFLWVLRVFAVDVDYYVCAEEHDMLQWPEPASDSPRRRRPVAQ